MLLAVGLFVAGMGTAIFLRTTLVTNVDTQIDALARTDVAGPLLDFSVVDGQLTVSPAENASPTDYFVAIYGPAEGPLLALVGGRGGTPPAVPDAYPLDRAQANELQPTTIRSADGSEEFRATIAVQEFEGALYSQLVAVSLASVNRTIANYLGIYTVLALVILVGSAVLTRFLVTLTFRSLGQVESTADAIAAGDFSQRMTDIEPKTTEVGRLKTAINAMLDRVDAAITQRDSTVRQMRRFVGDASHELRTPLVTVRGYAELYRMGAISGDEDVAQAMERIEKEAIRMGLLVEDLLALARLDERRDVVVASVDLRPIARDAAMDIRAASPMRAVTVIDATGEPTDSARDQVRVVEPDEAQARRRGAPATSAIARAGATLSLLRRRPRPVPANQATGAGDLPDIAPIEAPAAPPQPRSGMAPIVLGDENHIRQVVANLLGNARRFAPENSPIEVRVGVDGTREEGWIEVIDHGEGVPDQIKDRIFERFWRADTSRARHTGGTGLGLSIVASIVETLNGSVSVHDTPGGGATFRVGFPLARERDAAEHLHIDTQPLTPLDPDTL